MDFENIERPNHIKPTRLKSHIKPALTQAITSQAMRNPNSFQSI